MKNQTPTLKQRENLRIALSLSVAGMELSQRYRKRRIKALETAIMYLKAAIAELAYGEAAEMNIVMAARQKSLEYLTKSARKSSTKTFPSGGVHSNTQPEYMHRVETAFATGKTYPTLIALEDECAKCCVVQPEWEADFKKIRQTFYSEDRAKNGADTLQEIRRRLLSVQTEAAKRLLDKALDLQ